MLIYGIVLCSVTPDYAAFCDGLPDGFLTDPVRIIAAWEGGMSFHGGLLGVVIAVWLFCRRRKLEDAADRRSGLRLRAHRPVLRPHRQFRE